MSATKPGLYRAWFVIGILMLLIVACAAPAVQPGEAPAGQPAAPAQSDGILRISTNVNIPAPDIWNPYIPGTFILQGMNQNMMEPLFMLNYETGDIDGWLAEGYEAKIGRAHV